MKMHKFGLYASTAILLSGVIASSAIAQTKLALTLKPYDEKHKYVDFSSDSGTCEGTVMQAGMACVLNIKKNDSKFSRVAVLSLVNVVQTLRSRTDINVREFKPNKANIAFLITVNMYVDYTKSTVPLAQAGLTNQGELIVIPEYGEYGLEESKNVLERESKAIAILIKALKETK